MFRRGMCAGAAGLVGALTVAGLCGDARAALFSFASDDDSDAFTLSGTAGMGGTFGIRNGRSPLATPLTLRIDDDNGPLPTTSLAVGLRVDLTAAWAGSVGVLGSFSHLYTVSGGYSFVHPVTGAALIDVLVGEGRGAAVMSIGGSATRWGSAGTITGSDVTANLSSSVGYFYRPALITYAQSLGINLQSYGILVGSPFSPDDFAFTMTVLNSAAEAVAIDPTTRLPTGAWAGEASHSGRGGFIPGPGTAVLGVVGAWVCLGRRRRCGR